MHLIDFVFLVLAVFFVWQTVRYPFERFAYYWFDRTRVLHPLLVFGLAFYLTQEIVMAAAVAGAVGLLVAGAEKFLSGEAPVAVRRRGSYGLPRLPGE